MEDIARRNRQGQVVERDPPPSEMELYERMCRGHLKYKEIAEILSVSPTTARKRMEAIEVRLWSDLSKHVLRIKVGQTESLKHVAQEMLNSWDRSKGVKVVTHTRGTRDGNTYTETTETRSEGDVKYATEFRHCLQSIRGIWGADSPKQVEVTEKVDSKTTVQKLDEITQKMRELIPEAHYEVLENDAGIEEKYPKESGSDNPGVS